MVADEGMTTDELLRQLAEVIDSMWRRAEPIIRAEVNSARQSPSWPHNPAMQALFRHGCDTRITDEFLRRGFLTPVEYDAIMAGAPRIPDLDPFERGDC